MSKTHTVAKKPPERDPFQQALYDMSYEGRLEKFKAAYIGEFDTGLKCNCGCKIMDHATPVYPNMGKRWAPVDQTFDPMPKVRHAYIGEDCGAVYFGGTIEGKRGYKTREAIEKEKEKNGEK